MKNLRDKRALVTGAASGIGRAMALELAKSGTHLTLWDIDAPKLNSVADEARAIGVQVVADICNLAEPAQISAAVARLVERWQGVDILVNNAGIAYYGPTENMTAQQWDQVMSINLLAPIQITRELLPHLLPLPEAHVLNMCSISGLVAAGRFCAYHVSKFGLIGFSEALRAEYVRRGIGVTALCPGPVLTNLYESAMSGRTDRKVPSPPRWLCTTAETVARKGVRAIRQNKGLVIVSPMAHFLWRAKRLMPGVLDALNRITRKKRKPAVATFVPGVSTPTASVAANSRPSGVPAPHIAIHAGQENDLHVGAKR